MNNIFQHELDRVKSMTDDQLWVRYGKMTKEDKIESFYEVLMQEGRNESLQLEMAKAHGFQVGPVEKKKTMEFVRVLKNEDHVKQAIFLQPECGKYFLYSYIKNDAAHETMVFECDQDGVVEDHMDIVSGKEYVPSSEMMELLGEKLS